MKKEDLTTILHQTYIDFCDSLILAFDDFRFFTDSSYIQNSLISRKFGNFNLFDVIGTQKGFEHIFDNIGLIYNNKHYRRNLSISIFILQSIRSIINKPIIISSFFRSCKLNDLLKGVKKSYHLKGLAFDIIRTEFINLNSVLYALEELKKIFESNSYIINIIDKVQVIEYKSYLHIEIDIY